MCLIYLAWRVHPLFELVVAANRDEWHARPTAPAAWWEDAPGVLAGRDLEGGGTWMGLARSPDPGSHRRFRFAAITNYREAPFAAPALDHEPGAAPAVFRSRGELVRGFLIAGQSAGEYSRRVRLESHRYRGFSLLAGDGESLYFVSNRGGPPRPLDPGVYGLSNHLLDTPWPKVVQGKEGMRRLLRSPQRSPHDFFSLLTSRESPCDAALPKTGVGIERERFLSPRFIVGDAYGTRASTVLCLKSDGSGSLTERRFRPRGEFHDERIFEIRR